MKRVLTLITLIIFFVSCSLIKEKKAAEEIPELTPISKEELAQKIQEVITANEKDVGEIGLLFEDAVTKEVLFAKNENNFFKPASTNKLLTTITALNTLGTDFKYQTKLCTNGSITDGVLNGDLIIVGSGDPSFSPRFTKNKDDIVIIFREWADLLKKKNITRIKGNIIGDDDFFDDNYFLSSWYGGERAEWFSTEISGLAFNDNCIDLVFTGADKAGEPAIMTYLPNTKYVQVVNNVKTVEGNPKDISFEREDKSNVITADGEVAIGKKQKAWATIYNPTLFCATVFKETLIEEGIVVEGSANDIDDFSDKTQYKNTLNQITFYESPALPELIKVLNRVSHNFYADQIYKTLGKILGGEGSFEKSATAIQDFLKKNNIYQEGHKMVDGSGLSHENRVSPRMFVDLLKFMHSKNEWEIFKESLPQGAVRGTLSARYKSSPKDKYLGKHIFAKTGYIRKVVSLAGVITNDKGNDIIFSCVLNNYSFNNQNARDLLDKIVLIAAEYNMTIK